MKFLVRAQRISYESNSPIGYLIFKDFSSFINNVVAEKKKEIFIIEEQHIENYSYDGM